MSNRRYVLQKPTPTSSAGAIFKLVENTQFYHEIGRGWTYPKETVENSPDWFLPEQAEVENKDRVWNDRLLSVAEVMAASELVGEWNDNDLAYKFRRNNLIEIARRNFFNKTEQPKEWEIVREDYVGEGSHKQILSVRRVSDGEVFSVGDEVQHMEEKTDAGRITSFTLHAGIMVAYFKGGNGHEYYFNDISVINKKSNSKDVFTWDDALAIKFANDLPLDQKAEDFISEFKQSKQPLKPDTKEERVSVRLERLKHGDPRIKPLEIIIYPTHGIAEWQPPLIKNLLERFLNGEMDNPAPPNESNTKEEKVEVTLEAEKIEYNSTFFKLIIDGRHVSSGEALAIKQAIESVLNNDLAYSIGRLVEELEKDKSEGDSYYYSWQANIAVAFQDEYDKMIKEQPSENWVHELSNKAAKRFLDLLCYRPSPNPNSQTSKHWT